MKIIAYDATDHSAAGKTWPIGAHLYKKAGKADIAIPARTLRDVFDALPDEKITQLEFWCHGAPGMISFCGRRYFTGDIFAPMTFLGEHYSVDLIWFRSCSTFAGMAGQAFASTVSRSVPATVAGHTHKIAGLQAGLHTLTPGQIPYWDPLEGATRKQTGGQWSRPWSPNVITAWCNQVPENW